MIKLNESEKLTIEQYLEDLKNVISEYNNYVSENCKITVLDTDFDLIASSLQTNIRKFERSIEALKL